MRRILARGVASRPQDRKGRPVPFVVRRLPRVDFGTFDVARQKLALTLWLCSVCAHPVWRGYVLLPLEKGEPPVHRRCLLESSRMCPHLAQSAERSFLWARRIDMRVLRPRGLGGVALMWYTKERRALPEVRLIDLIDASGGAGRSAGAAQAPGGGPPR